MKMKKVSALVLSSVMMASLFAGCGSNSSGDVSTSTGSASVSTNVASESSSAVADQEVTLKVLAGQSTTDTGIEDMIDKALAKKYPNITLEWECVGWGQDFNAKMQQYMQSGLPDIMVGKAQDVATYGSKGLLGDMKGKPYINNVMEAAIPGVTVDGKVEGLVYNALYQGVYYNRKIFKDNNIEVPKTMDELNAVIQKLKSLNITPFATHFLDTWSIGNITMQFAINDVFNKEPKWGDKLRAGEVTFEKSPEYRASYENVKLLYDNTWTKETFSLEQTECDKRLITGKAAMKVSGSWSIQNFLDVDKDADFGVFPFPNKTGDARLIFEPNITFMKSANSENQDAIDKVFDVITSDKDLALEIYNFTKTAPMIKGITPTFPNPSQSDIDKYAAAGNIVDANTGNTQLTWGGFQEENAKDIATWLQGKTSLDAALKAADSRKANSKG
ncbi:MAG: extracellular solute-binding protein [Eubacterium sp.]|nr:extracellular solute-binding protein [Eubacterium sp.]